jgi:uncharacterized protein (TIGR01777 family)
MKILVTGASGLVGSALIPLLTASGHSVSRLVRNSQKTGAGAFYWNPATRELDAAAVEGQDAVIHLAGESIASGYWTKARKVRIRDSRVVGTQILADAIVNASVPPQLLISASAIGYYGSPGAAVVDETNSDGDTWLAEICREWEAATESVRAEGVRVVNARIGLVLTPEGGALGKMLLPFKLCLGGRLGHGRQYMSWITLDDMIRSLQFAVENESVSGPMNVVAPNPVTNLAFTKLLGGVLRRPTPFPVPAFFLRLVLGEMADELFFSSIRVVPKVLLDHGFEFTHGELEFGLRDILNR